MELNSGVALKKIAKKFFPRVNKSHPSKTHYCDYFVTCERKGTDCIQVHKVTGGAVVSTSAQNVDGLGSIPTDQPIFSSGSLGKHVTSSSDINSLNSPLDHYNLKHLKTFKCCWTVLTVWVIHFSLRPFNLKLGTRGLLGSLITNPGSKSENQISIQFKMFNRVLEKAFFL